jgi:CxxC motif-containing protein (DUF1111 family)
MKETEQPCSEAASKRVTTRRRYLLALCALASVLTIAPTRNSQRPEPSEELSGGETTVFQNGQNAFALPLANISRKHRREHVVGNSFFNKNWVAAPASTEARDGLGPFFHARSCSGCHVRDGRGKPPEGGRETMTGLLLRLSVPGRGPNAEPVPHPVMGGQYAPRAIPGVEPEGNATITYTEVQGTYADGTRYSLRRPEYQLSPNPIYGEDAEEIMIGPRLAPPVHGSGLLEAIPEMTILALADPEDADGDGISGRPNRVWNPDTGRNELGRFGWKANQPTLERQVADAFLGDIGVTSSRHPKGDWTEVQEPHLRGLPDGGDPEISDRLFDRVVTYLRTLAPPARRDWDKATVLEGRELFKQANCISCHTPELATGESLQIPELSNQTIRPFTDLLLHDMGEGLADGRPDFEATGREWRTPPLWGIGLVETVNGHTYFLHDGRARNLEEAILWHGGEAEVSKKKFRRMSAKERAALIRFLKSL